MATRKSLSIYPDRYCKPLLGAELQAAFDVVFEAPTPAVLNLRRRERDVAMIPPLEYAQDGSLFRIVRGVAVSSRGASGAAVLHCRPGIKTISTLAVDPRFAADVVLAKFVLAEEFNVAPTIIPMDAHVDEMLDRADAALASGDEAIRVAARPSNMIDLVEAWGEMTDLPYVHGLFCCRDGSLSASEARILGERSTVDDAHLLSIAGEGPTESSTHLGTDEKSSEYLLAFSYDLSTSVEEAIQEFLQYAYFHGVLPDVPQLHYYSDDEDLPDPFTT